MIKTKTVAVSACLCLSVGMQTSRADFALNWAADPVNRVGGAQVPFANCNRGEPEVNCFDQSRNVSPLPDPDKTPFLQERVRGTDGNVYYHVVIGLPTSDFSQEIFIRTNNPGTGPVWGNGFIAVEGSSSGGNFTFAPAGDIFSSSQLFDNMKPLDADENISGNSTGNPTRVIMRQINRGGDFSQEFLKDNILNKPRITQSITNADLSMQFVADMRNLSYSDSTTSIPLINTINMTGGAGSFDMATDAQSTHVTAGQFQWLAGSDPNGTNGTYQYLEGGYNPLIEDWKSFRDPAQNPVSIKNN